MIKDMKTYFSEWFNIISKSIAFQLWKDKERSFSVLRSDGTDCYADCYNSWEEIPKDALFGIEKIIVI